MAATMGVLHIGTVGDSSRNIGDSAYGEVTNSNPCLYTNCQIRGTQSMISLSSRAQKLSGYMGHPKTQTLDLVPFGWKFLG